MKKNLILIAIISIAFSLGACNKKDESIEGKKAKLTELKAKQLEIQQEISKLETALKNSGVAGELNKVKVSFAEVKPEEFKRFIEVQGVVESEKAVMVSTRMGGTIKRVNVAAGDMVKAGQVLLEIDDDAMQKGVNELQTQIEFANTLFEKQKRLYDKKAISEVQFLTAKNQKDALDKKMITLKRQIENSKVVAPFAGVIDQVIPKAGEGIGDGIPVFKLTSMADVRVTANVSETYGSTFKQGVPVTLNFTDVNEQMTAKVSTVSKAIDAMNRAFKIQIKMPKVPAFIKPNMVCGVSINDVTLKDAIVIPLNIVQREGEKNFIFVAENTDKGLVAKKRFVTIGLSHKDKAQVTDGLKTGEKIIIAGALDVTDGQPLKVD